MCPLTAPGAAWGGGFRHGIELMLDDVNAAGGVIVGGVRYKFQAFVEDDKYNVSISAEATHKLVYQEKVNYVMGPFGSAGGLAVVL